MEKDRIYKYEPLWGDWYIKSFIGEGTFGKVYIIEKSEESSTYRAAVKLITIPTPQQKLEAQRSFGSDGGAKTAYFNEIVENVVNEINLLNKLSGSGHIVEYKDHKIFRNDKEESADIIIRMEMLTDIRSYYTQKPAALRDIIRMAKDVCIGLEICAKYGVVHRDIKLDNIFISEHGIYKIGDFGVSRFMGTSGASTVVGTYEYIAPEVVREGSYDGRVDIYSLGLAMYRLLNNDRMPFMPAYPANIKMKDRDEAYRKRMTGTPLEQPAITPDVLWKVIERACSYDPKDRFNSASEMREALEDAERVLTREQLNKVVYPPVPVTEKTDKTSETVYPYKNVLDKIEGTPGTIPVFAEQQEAEIMDDYAMNSIKESINKNEGTLNITEIESPKNKKRKSEEGTISVFDNYYRVEDDEKKDVSVIKINREEKGADVLSDSSAAERRKRWKFVGGFISLIIISAYLLMGFISYYLWHPAWIIFIIIPIYLLIYIVANRKNSVMVLGLLISGLITCLATIAFLTMGFAGYLWHPGWIVFISIPISLLIFCIIKRKNSVMVLGLLISGLVTCLATVAFLTMGFVGYLWHPGWIVYLSVPICMLLYYIIKKIQLQSEVTVSNNK